MNISSWFGIDVAKCYLDISDANGHHFRVPNNATGHATVIHRLRKRAVNLITLESTGVYARDISTALVSAGLPTAVVQPQRVRRYAQALSQHAKTDRIDAAVIARFGEAIQPRRLQPSDQTCEELRDLVDWRHQLVEDRVCSKNRLESCRHPSVQAAIKRQIATLEQEIATVDQQIDDLIAKEKPLQQRYRALMNVSGVGRITAMTLLAHVPELGQVSRQSIAALVGLAPYDRSSGEQDKKRHIYGGRYRVRKILYMAALTGSRSNDVLRETYLRLCIKGKPAKVALIACARKLITWLNTVVAKLSRQNTPMQAI